MKKTFVLLICVCLVFGFASSVYAADAYRDVPGEAWYAEAVEYVTESGLMQGVGNNAFDPDGLTTRGMIVSILWRHTGEEEINQPYLYFWDARKEWYSEAAEWGYWAGIVKGIVPEWVYTYEPTTWSLHFMGDAPVTREELACFLYRYAKYAGADVSETAALEGFADAASVSDWAEEALGWCVAEGIIQGTPAGDSLNLAPADHATRAEVAAMLMRYCQMIGQ